MQARLREHPNSPIAGAFAFLNPDGSSEIGAVGVEPEFAGRMADDAADLANQLSSHSPPKPRRLLKIGIAAALACQAAAFATAAYINELAWLDAAIVVASQATLVVIGLAHSRWSNILRRRSR